MKQPRFRVNDQIRAAEVRLVSADGNQLGIKPLEEAMRIAAEAQLDLVEVAPTAKPPVCKIVDHGKVLFDQRQRMKAQKKKQHHTDLKEVWMKLKIGQHDFETKLKRARKFLEHGDKVKFTIRFRGREVTHQEIGRVLATRIQTDLGDIAQLEGTVGRMGRVHTFLMSRRKDYKPPAKQAVEEPARKKPRKAKQPKPDSAPVPGGRAPDEAAPAVSADAQGAADGSS